MSIFATPEQVAELKIRTLQWQADGYPGADSKISYMMVKFPHH